MPINSFDAIRLIAALLVVYGHAYPLSAAGSPAFAGNSVQAIGVKVFFVISGYLIMGSWQRDPNVFRFTKRRMLRILPGLAVVVALSALVLGPAVSSLSLLDYFKNSRTLHYFSNVLMRPQYDLPGVFVAVPYPNAVNGSLWSLPAEVAMYVIGPFAWWVGVTFVRSARAGVAFALVMLVFASLYFVRFAPPLVPLVVYGSSVSSFLDVAPYFLIGAVYALWHLEQRIDPHVAGVAWILFSLVQLPPILTEFMLYILLPYTVLAFGLRASRVGQFLSGRGDISYGVYLYGFPLQQLVALLVEGARTSPWTNFAVTLLPVLFFASISWRFVERPALRWKPAKSAGVNDLSTNKS